MSRTMVLFVIVVKSGNMGHFKSLCVTADLCGAN